MLIANNINCSFGQLELSGLRLNILFTEGSLLEGEGSRKNFHEFHKYPRKENIEKIADFCDRDFARFIIERSLSRVLFSELNLNSI